MIYLNLSVLPPPYCEGFLMSVTLIRISATSHCILRTQEVNQRLMQLIEDKISNMEELEAKGSEFERKADKKIQGWSIFGSKYDDAAELYEKAGNSYKLTNSWDKVGSTYIKLENCHLKLESKHEAASVYVDAANCYKKNNIQEAMRCLNLIVNLFLEIGKLAMAAKHCKEIGDLYDSEENFESIPQCYG